MKHNKAKDLAVVLNVMQYLSFDSHKCKACWDCVETCPNEVIGKINILFGLHKHIKFVNGNKCVGCYKCVKVCKHEALTRINNCIN